MNTIGEEITNGINPTHVFVENIRVKFGMKYHTAKMFCDLLAKEGVFEKKYNVMCKKCRRGLHTFTTIESMPQTVKCDNCEALEEEVFEHKVTMNDVIEFYVVVDDYEPNDDYMDANTYKRFIKDKRLGIALYNWKSEQ